MQAQAEGYTSTARLLHWTIAVIVLMMIPAGLIMTREGLPRGLQDTLFIFHKNAGIVVLLLMLSRLFWRLGHPAPPLPGSVPDWQQRAARISHAALYVMLLVMPVSGYLRVRAGGFPIEGLDAIGVPTLVAKSKPLEQAAQATHFYGFLIITALLLLHVAAALQHLLIQRDGVFFRMWPPIRPRR